MNSAIQSSEVVPAREGVLTPVADGFDGADFGRRLVEARKRLNMTQTDLGDRVGVTKASVSSWEAGNGMGLGTFMRVCKVLEVSPNDLLPVSNDVATSEVFAKGDAGPMKLISRIAGLIERGSMTPNRVGILMALLEDFEQSGEGPRR